MRNIEEIVVNRAAINVLDRENNTVVAAEKELELTEEVYGYFERHILKVLKDDDARMAFLDSGGNIVRELCREMFEEEDMFVADANKLSQYLFKCMANDEKEVSGDLAVCMFESQEGRYLALLKLNFTDSFCNYARDAEGKPDVAIGVNRTGLPGLGQKLSKAVIIKNTKDENEYNLLVADKDQEGMFINAFLKCKFVRDRRENTRIIHKTSENFVRKVFKDNVQEAESFRNKMRGVLRSEDQLDIEQLAEQSFSDSSIRQEYRAALACEGIDAGEVPIDREWAEKKLKRKRLKVDKSIELYIDSDVYNDSDKFQIKRNGDGTIDIILKNVRNYTER